MTVNYIILLDIFLILVLELGRTKRALFGYVAWDVMEVACDGTAINGR